MLRRNVPHVCSRIVNVDLHPNREKSISSKDRTPLPYHGTNKEKILGIKFYEKNQARRFNILNEREMRTTKWACPSTINRVRIGNDFDLLCNNVGIRHFVMQDVPTYRRLTLEFLSTFKHTFNAFHYSDVEERTEFQLMNNSYDMNVTEWCNRFSFANNNGHTRTSNSVPDPPPHEYFKLMSVHSHTYKGDMECVLLFAIFSMFLLTFAGTR